MNLGGLNLTEALLEFGPVLHDDLGAKSLELLSHLQFLVIITVTTDIANDRNAGTDGAESTRLAVLDGNSLLGLLLADIEGVEVDGGIRLGGGLGKRASRTEDQFGVKVLVLADLLDGSLDTTEGRRRDDSKAVLLRSEDLIQLLVDADARLSLLIQLGDNLGLLLLDVGLEFILGQLELVLGLK